VVAAIAEQAASFIHAQVNCYTHPLLEQLAERLARITPDGIDTFFFTNSGAEATEASVKLAKQATGRPNVIVFSGSFHGRTHLAMAMTTSRPATAPGTPAACRRVRVAVPGDRSGTLDDASTRALDDLRSPAPARPPRPRPRR
jgi:4-aminobutyrate aminotransferase-like enzyme